ncbi:MAG: hypothetical protein IPF97_04130 [Sphingomonadales bacterium]|nr:hypothetical protein [Sphingomonadales bacterium]
MQAGYLINQFLNPASNRRTDSFGGLPENRAAFPARILAHMAELIGPRRVGLRISPGNPYNGMDTADPALFSRRCCAAESDRRSSLEGAFGLCSCYRHGTCGSGHARDGAIKLVRPDHSEQQPQGRKRTRHG